MGLSQDEIFEKVQEALVDALGVDDDAVANPSAALETMNQRAKAQRAQANMSMHMAVAITRICFSRWHANKKCGNNMYIPKWINKYIHKQTRK